MTVKPSPNSWMKHSVLTLGSLPVRILFILLLAVLALGYAISLSRADDSPAFAIRSLSSG